MILFAPGNTRPRALYARIYHSLTGSKCPLVDLFGVSRRWFLVGSGLKGKRTAQKMGVCNGLVPVQPKPMSIELNGARAEPPRGAAKAVLGESIECLGVCQVAKYATAFD